MNWTEQDEGGWRRSGEWAIRSMLGVFYVYRRKRYVGCRHTWGGAVRLVEEILAQPT